MAVGTARGLADLPSNEPRRFRLFSLEGEKLSGGEICPQMHNSGREQPVLCHSRAKRALQAGVRTHNFCFKLLAPI